MVAREELGGTLAAAPGLVFACRCEDLPYLIESVLSGYFSLTTSSPHLFGTRLDDFAVEVRRLLRERSPGGLFWDWPGDTAVILARKG